MYSNNMKTIMIFTFFIVLSVVDESLLYHIPVVLNLSEGSICGKDEVFDMDLVCKRPCDCETLSKSIKSDYNFDICSFEGRVPIVCCPSTFPNVSVIEEPAMANVRSSNVASQKCKQYNALNFPEESYFQIFVVGGIAAKAHEFPHMAILGYGSTTENKYDWRCGGTLISEKWILSAGHCHRENLKAQWARLGDLNIDSTTDDAQPKDYRIVQHVIHPGYKPPKKYNDIALFQLEKEVEFSLYVRPVCLNTDHSKRPTQLIATGWGQTGTAESKSDILLKVTLNIYPTSKCNGTFFSQNNKEIELGILDDSMICAGSSGENEDTCTGDSGGPIQIRNDENIKTYTQFGITSFGPGFCGDKEKPAVYTKVSKYVKWIEGIVWSDS